MREIKFRAWQKYHKKMVEVTSISFDDNGEINGVATFVENQAPQRISYRDDLLGRFFLKDERGMVLELMQYTGLKDKNGVEIYEGDVYHHGDPRITYTVVWVDSGLKGKQNGCSGSYAGLESWCERIEVIGNIYEHNHLLG